MRNTQQTKTNYLIKLLKRKWISNWKACELLKSGSGDRLMRFIKADPPENYTMQERTRKAKIDKLTIVYKEFKLCKI